MDARNDAGDGPHDVVSEVVDADSERWRALAADREPRDDSFRPKGWSRPAAVAGFGCLSVGFGVTALVTGLGIAISAMLEGHALQGVSMGMIMGGGGAWILFFGGIGSFRFGAGRAPRLVTVQDGNVVRAGVRLPYSRTRLVQGVAASLGAALCGAGLLLGAAAGIGWPGLVLGAPFLLGGAVGVVSFVRRSGADSGLLLVPEGVLQVRGARRTFVPWAQILVVKADHWGIVGPPMLRLWLAGKPAIETTTPDRGVTLRRRRTIDLSSDIWMLAVDPTLVYAALRYYTDHAERRAELDDNRGVLRIAQPDLR